MCSFVHSTKLPPRFVGFAVHASAGAEHCAFSNLFVRIGLPEPLQAMLSSERYAHPATHRGK